MKNKKEREKRARKSEKKASVMGRLVGNDSGKKIESILCSLAIYFSAICFLAYSSSLIYYYTNKSKKENNSELWTNYFQNNIR